jgi:hypothetical protein
MRVEFTGTETLTLEIEGTLPHARAEELAGPGVEVQRAGDRAVVSLLLFQMKGLRPRGLPAPALDYGEALWRIGAVRDGESAWFGHACDIDHPLVRLTGAWLVRYPIRVASFTFDDDGEGEGKGGCSVIVDAESKHFKVRARPAETRGEGPAASPPRRIFVRSRGALFEIPWREDPAPRRWSVTLDLADVALGVATFGADVAWAPSGVVHRGRIHRCGLARRIG